MRILFVAGLIIAAAACNKKEGTDTPVTPTPFSFRTVTIDARALDNMLYGVSLEPVITVSFGQPLLESSVDGAVALTESNGAAVAVTTALDNHDSGLIIHSVTPLKGLAKYVLKIGSTLKSAGGGTLSPSLERSFITQVDSSDKFPRISDSALLDLVEQTTFRYFWDFGHPVSGMARDRNTSGDVCTTSGTGFGVMSILVAVNRHFISRADAVTRVRTIVSFLQNNCSRYHGAFAHWVNGSTGVTIPFSPLDDGADIVETSFLLQGLLCARQYFNGADLAETQLRNDINEIWNGVEWNWFRQNGQQVLYWHWSPDNGWAINMPVNGWDEALAVYVLAASSNTDSIPKSVYDNGWAKNGGIKNGNSYYGVTLPLGPPLGGPLFFAHYSFLGIDPHQLTDNYADYWQQDTAHAIINFSYCVNNPKKFYGYSASCWGLTASDDDVKGYDAHSPTNDDGVISPTAAIASLPYTPSQSMNALKFFYYKLGDRLWGEYGFVDAFNLNSLWFASSFLAIDQGPEIVMIENYRSSLLWDLFMSCPEVRSGMKKLGFNSPHL